MCTNKRLSEMTRCLGCRHKRENKNTKLPPKHPVKNTTVNTTGVDHKTPASENTEHCGICKSSKRHKLQECPIIKQCEHVAVRRQYAASCGFCFNCGLEKPGHGSGSCPDPPTCSVCLPVDTFLFCTLKVIMAVVASSHGIIESLMISLTSHWRRLNPQTAKGEMSLQPRAETSL